MRPIPTTRRALLLALGALPLATLAQGPSKVLVEVWKDPACGCCHEWVKHLQDHGFAIGVGRRVSLVHQLLGAQREVEPDLLLDVADPAVLSPEREVQDPSNSVADHDALVPPASLAAVRISVTVPAYCTQFRVSARR